MVYKNYNLPFTELFRKDILYLIHRGNINLLAIELYKVRKPFSNQIMYNIFKNLNALLKCLRAQCHCSLRRVNF